jgi:hypothetical protein
MADQLRKVQAEAYYNIYKSMAIADWQLPWMARARARYGAAAALVV